VRAPAIKVAPNNGAKNITTFQYLTLASYWEEWKYAGRQFAKILSFAFKYRDKNTKPAKAAVECPLGKDSNESLIVFSSPVQIVLLNIISLNPLPIYTPLQLVQYI
jgi:hypothetical protein